MDMDARLIAEPAQVLLDLRVVLAATDKFGDSLVECLDADLELERSGWELPDRFAQRLRQAVGNHLEVHKQPRPMPFEKELQDGRTGLQVEIEGAIDELKLSQAAVEQPLHCRQKLVERSVTHRDVERRQAELAFERAAARRFHIDDALRDVGVRVQFIRQRQAIKIGQGSGNDFHWWRVSPEGLPAHLGKRQIGLTDDDVIGQPDDFLPVAFVADLRAAEDDDQFRPQPLQIRHDLQRLRHVPDVDADTDDLWVIPENHLDDIDRPLIDVELKNPRLRLEFA